MARARESGRAASGDSIALLLAYDGTAYHGWQIQSDVPTVQGVLSAALHPLRPGGALPVGASRTDAGVHALGQVASVGGPWRVGPATVQAALNATLPRDVRVIAARAMPAGFDARRSARLKRYAYLIEREPVALPFRRAYTWHLPRRMDVPAAARALAALRGRHDFSAFQATPGRGRSPRSPRNPRNPWCTIRAVRVVERGSLLALLVSADAFLHHMVRNIVGTVVEIACGRRSVDWMEEVLGRRERELAGPTAPAHGLHLVSVRYPGPLFPGRARLAARSGRPGR